ncbi:acetate kinase [Coprinopsis marcescibilis]|uniref:Probable acetate kinase n=1 Tax=Coprinopsis marcescibilis TaxID=230819 RepID=A0A5C3L588_COPMA|nr:acetate kinase [Coprinopsis marcescibilis]
MSVDHRDLILAVNSGSSSLKASLFVCLEEPVAHERSRAVELILSLSLTSISSPSVAQFSFRSKRSQENQEESLDSIKDHAAAFSYFLDRLKKIASIDPERIGHVCHRVVHGGDYLDPVIITKESYSHIEKLSDLAPLHNGAALSVIEACISALPNAISIAYFDTSFHRSIPPHIASNATNQEVAKERGLKKYGFHGLSYSYILRSVANHLGQPVDTLNLVVMHLGSGASVCAIKNGRSLDTSMGLTPADGLPGATRSGAIDPSLIFHYTNRAGRITHDPSMAAEVGVTHAEEILNREAGWKSITGTTDFGKITSNAELDNPDPDVATRNPNRLAFDLFVDRILDYVGSYHLKLDGKVDALVFSGGIGEKGVQLRATISKRVRCLGYQKLDETRNNDLDPKKEVIQISVEGTTEGPGPTDKQKRLLVCHTDEQFEMANDCASDLSRWDTPSST